MPAIWTGPGALQPPQPHNIARPFRSQTLPLPRDEDSRQDIWQNDFDQRLHGLGITNGPFKYEVRRGKTVPVSGQVSPPADCYDIAAPPVHDAPARYPRRPHRDFNRSTCSFDDPAPVTASRFKTAANDMYGRPTAALEISPPSSPEINAVQDSAYGEDVSPIDESPDASQQDLLAGEPPRYASSPSQEHQSRSLLPVMRRDKRRNHNAPAVTLRPSRSKDMLQDQSDHSLRQPWEDGPNQSQAYSDQFDHTFGVTTTVTAPHHRRTGNPPPPSFGQRMRQFARGKAESIDNRPPWNGASGRMSMVAPVRDDLTVQPLKLPRRSSKRVGRNAGAPPVNTAGSETSNGAVATVRRLLPSRSNQKLKEAARSASQADLTSQTSLPGSYRNPSDVAAESPSSQSHTNTQSAPPSHPSGLLTPNTTPDPNKAFKRKPSPHMSVNTKHNPRMSTSSSVYSNHPDHSNPAFGPVVTTTPPSTSPFTPRDPWVQPPSRFSVTTCNTNVPGSPRESLEEDRPPVPPQPQLPSVMDRRRPVPGGDSSRSPSAEPIVVSIHSSYVPNSTGRGRGQSGQNGNERPVSVMSTSKALPPAPPELQSANDRIANLNARLENLAHLRGNITKSIKQMTELMPHDNLMASADVLRKREIEKKKVEGLKEELAEIQREEYDLGLKLHRAYKRLERDASYEPTTLWVRRVTD